MNTDSPKHRFFQKTAIGLAIIIALLILISGPAAQWLQARNQRAAPQSAWDAVYLVCGARAQNRRIQALTHWIEKSSQPPALLLIGNDRQNSLWSSKHQRNLNRREWAEVRLSQWLEQTDYTNPITLLAVPGYFSNTDGEMQALADFLKTTPDIKRIALVTSRFHARRVLQRFHQYNPDHINVAIVPGIPYWKNRAPWVVLSEYVKLIRDQTGLNHHPLLTRPLEPQL